MRTDGTRGRVLILGAGCGGLELAARLSESMAGQVGVTLVDQHDAFAFGSATLDVAFGRRAGAQVRHPYRDVVLPGVEFRQERVTSIDPRGRSVATDRGTHHADVLVVALGADRDAAATPGFAEDGFELHSVAGAERLGRRLATLDGGDVLIAVLGTPSVLPPAPYEAALLLHDLLVERGVRSATRIELMSPTPSPVPVSPSTSAAIVDALAQREIGYAPGRRVLGLDPRTHVAQTDDDTRRYDVFVGIPDHRVPRVVERSGLTVNGTDGWVAVDPRTLTTRFPRVYALGGCVDAPVPRAGAFAESAARVVADHIAVTLVGGGPVTPYDGTGACYVEMGGGLVGRVDADFLGGPSPKASFHGPSRELAEEKARFAATRRRRWFAGAAEGRPRIPEQPRPAAARLR